MFSKFKNKYRKSLRYGRECPNLTQSACPNHVRNPNRTDTKKRCHCEWGTPVPKLRGTRQSRILHNGHAKHAVASTPFGVSQWHGGEAVRLSKSCPHPKPGGHLKNYVIARSEATRQPRSYAKRKRATRLLLRLAAYRNDMAVSCPLVQILSAPQTGRAAKKLCHCEWVTPVPKLRGTRQSRILHDGHAKHAVASTPGGVSQW